MSSESLDKPHFTLIDIGVNLTNRAFDHRHADIVKSAGVVGVTKQIITGTSIAESQAAARMAHALSNTNPSIKLFSTAGVHPHDASTWNADANDSIQQLAAEPQVVAIGECGLDYNRNYSTPAEQRKAFTAQIALAIETGLPIFLHERDAFADMQAILREHRAVLRRAVVHCFTGTAEQAMAYLALDCHLGITGWVCDERRGSELQSAVKIIPDDRFMLETDAPYLLPRTLKPKPKSRHNLPEYLPAVASMVADLRGFDIQTIAQQSTATAERFFAI